MPPSGPSGRPRNLFLSSLDPTAGWLTSLFGTNLPDHVFLDLHNQYCSSSLHLLSSLLCAHAAILINLPLPCCPNRTFLFPIFGQFVPAS